MIQAIIFDLDDTLVKTQEPKIKLIQYTGKIYYGLDIPKETIQSLWGTPFRELMENLFADAGDIDEIIERYWSVRDLFPTAPYPDAVDTVTKLAERIPVGILSSATKKMVMGDLTSMGFPVNRLFHIQSAEDTDVHKPDPLVFAPLIAKLNTKSILPDNVLYVGDMPIDYEAAKNAGFLFLGIPDRTTSRETFSELGATTVIHLADIFNLINV